MESSRPQYETACGKPERPPSKVTDRHGRTWKRAEEPERAADGKEGASDDGGCAGQRCRGCEQEFHRLIESIPEVFCETDESGVIVMANQRAFDRFEYARSDLEKGLNVLDMIAEPDRARARNNIGKLAEGGVSGPNEYVVQTRTGKTFPALVHSQPVFRHGRYAGFRATIVDITEQKRTEKALEDSAALYRNTIDGLDAAVHVVDERFRIVLVNRFMARWLERLGIDGAVVGKTVFEVLPQSAERLQKEYTEVLHSGRPLITEAVTTLARGEVITETRKIPVAVDDKVTAIITVIRDITAQRVQEREIRKLQALETVETLAGKIAHDFNNVLTGVMGGLSLVKEDLDPESDQFAILGEAEDASLKAKALATQLLTFAKGGAPLKKTVAIESILAESATAAVAGSGVRCTFAIPADLWKLDIDEEQFRHAFRHLIVNAREAMANEGTVEIRAENVTIPPDASLPANPGDAVLISIRDSGMGMDRETLRKSFVPFFGTKPRGLGLGLSLSHSIVRRHGGAMVLESSQGQGTTVMIYLPAVRRPQEADGEKSPTRTAPAALEKRILIMDDDPTVRLITKRLLVRLGHDVECASDGLEAIEMYEGARNSGTPFDCVVLDLSVPGGMGGKQTMERLREIDSAVKAIVCSGYSDDPVMTEFEKHHFRGCVRKPFNAAEFKEVVERVLR